MEHSVLAVLFILVSVTFCLSQRQSFQLQRDYPSNQRSHFTSQRYQDGQSGRLDAVVRNGYVAYNGNGQKRNDVTGPNGNGYVNGRKNGPAVSNHRNGKNGITLNGNGLKNGNGYKFNFVDETDNGLSVYGNPGVDFPIYSEIPPTGFQCSRHVYPGYYADTETRCQVFHICHHDGRQHSFLCPNATIFNQKHFVCSWWNNVNCEDAVEYYHLNEKLYQGFQEEPQNENTEQYY